MKLERKQIGKLFQERKFEMLRSMYEQEPSLFEENMKRLLFDSAVTRSDFDALQFLLDIGFSINTVSYTGTPLSRAASDGSVDLISWLIEKGAKPDESSIATNPLYSAIQGENLDVVKYFVGYGVDTEKKYECGRNAIDFARIWNNPAIISELGGDPNWKRPPWVLCDIPDLTGQRPSKKLFDYVEEELGFDVPPVFVEFLTQNLPERMFYSNSKDNDDWVWLGEDYLLFHTARSMIAYNCVDPEKRPKVRRHQGYFVVGTNGGGDDYCLDTISNENIVWIHDHEAEEFHSTKLTIEEFYNEKAGERENP